MKIVKDLIKNIGFHPKEGANSIYCKTYTNHAGYTIELDFKQNQINYGSDIEVGDLTTSNFSNSENFVVLECVNRLLEKGYSPNCIALEHKWALGRKEKGKLDIIVFDENRHAYLMIECKTWGTEYKKERRKMLIDGGQLFSYFQQDKSAKYLCLYTSRLIKSTVEYANDIVLVDGQWRELSNQKEIVSYWNKSFKDNGIFEDWATAYDIEIKALTRGRLKALTEEDSSRIFNQFAEILRHNVISDKPNAFNKVLNLFICKVIDEDRDKDDELNFQLLDTDTNETLQIRLNDLYKKGMFQFLNIDIADYTEEQLDTELSKTSDFDAKKAIKKMFLRLRLQKNTDFAFKDVYDDKTFSENAKVVKEIVELLQPYQFRYAHKQQFLGNFFELLLNTSIKQEAGQFFTPVPIASFIVSCLPIQGIIEKKIKDVEDNFLPYAIDYAMGSGHFLTEWMDEVQRIVEKISMRGLTPSAKKKLESWKVNQFAWAGEYVYGIDADPRLVKASKVCAFLNGDGDAVILKANGLDSFEKSEDYKGRLLQHSKHDKRENAQFDVLIANPPYSVSAFKNTLKNGNESFELFDRLTDQSSEIECLFIERAKQLLKVGGVAGIILPSSILNNAGIYTKSREIILQYFDLVAITELGSNTFMATGTNTVALFLRRKNNYDSISLRKSVDSFFTTLLDLTLNGIETPAFKYVSHVWEGISFDDYITLLQKEPNKAIEGNELYQEYRKKIKSKTNKEFWNIVLERESEKLYYFVLAYPQKVVLVKSGEKNVEKHFLGYEFSNRRGSEGIHPIKRGKTIDECTKLFDAEVSDNPEKASTYIHKAFTGDLDFPIHENMNENVSRANLVDMMTFDRVDFEKNVSLITKKKVRFENIWQSDNLVILNDVANIRKGTSITKEKAKKGDIPVVAGGQDIAYYHNAANRDGNIITISASGAYSGFINYFDNPIFASDCNTVQSKEEASISTKLIYHFLKSIQNEIYELQRGQAQPHVYGDDIAKIKIPFPPKGIQKKIVADIREIEDFCLKEKQSIEIALEQINNVFSKLKNKEEKVLGEIAEVRKGSSITKSKTRDGVIPVIAGGRSIAYYHDIANRDSNIITISASGAYAGFVNYFSEPIFASDCNTVQSEQENVISTKFIYYFLKTKQNDIYKLQRGQAQPHVYGSDIVKIKIPFPSIIKQNKMVMEIEALEKQIVEAQKVIDSDAELKNAVLKKYL